MVRTFNLKSKVIIITGGYGYLGKAIVESLIFHEAIVYVLGRREKIFNFVFDKFQSNRNLKFIFCELNDVNEIKKVIDNIWMIEGKIDVFINNAFQSKGSLPETINENDWNFGIEGTLNIVYRCITAIIPFFKSQSYGKIINVSSMYGIVAPQFEVYNDSPDFTNPPNYGAAKAGIIQLTKYYASYLGHFNILINSISPGPFPSLEVQKDDKFITKLKEKTCLNKIGDPEDLAGAFVFLSSEASNYITGQNIIIDGGWTAK